MCVCHSYILLKCFGPSCVSGVRTNPHEQWCPHRNPRIWIRIRTTDSVRVRVRFKRWWWWLPRFLSGGSGMGWSLIPFSRSFIFGFVRRQRRWMSQAVRLYRSFLRRSQTRSCAWYAFRLKVYVDWWRCREGLRLTLNRSRYVRSSLHVCSINWIGFDFCCQTKRGDPPTTRLVTICRPIWVTSSPAVAVRPRDASCLSVASENTIRRVHVRL